jgi:hypothetical protein
MSRIPLEGSKPSELGTDDVGGPLDRPRPIWFESSGIDGAGFPKREVRCWLRRKVVSKLKMTTTIRAKVAMIPIKRTMDDFVIDPEELIDLFPS